MSNQTAQPPTDKPAQPQSGTAQSGPAQSGSTQSGSAQAGPAKPASESPRRESAASRPRAVPRRRGGGLLLVLLVLIIAAFVILVLSPDQVGKLIASWTGRTPPATISVTPAPGGPPAGSTQTPAARPSTAPAIPPTAAPNVAAVNSELQTLRTLLADVAGRLGALERGAAETGKADLANRLNALDTRVAALLDQPVVTPTMLTDALNENRQAAQAAAQQASQTAAQDAARTAAQEAAKTAERAIQTAVQDAVQKATAAQKDVTPALTEIDKRLAVLEKMAPAVVAIADIERRLTGIEKMAPAIAAIADLERRLAGLEKTAAQAKSVSDLERRVTGVERTTGPLTAMSQSALQGEALALGLLNLRLALDRGAPYADVLSALRVAAASDPVLATEVERLAPSAASGAPTIASLRQRLTAFPAAETPKPPETSEQQPPSATPAAEARGFWAEIGQRLASMVTVRRLDVNAAQPLGTSSSGAGTMPSAVQRAAARLAADDLAGAIAMLDSDSVRRALSDTQQVALDDWLRDAQARLAAETGFATLSRRSLSLFSAKAQMPAAVAPGETPPGP